MKEDLKRHLTKALNLNDEWNRYDYHEDINEDALSEKWLVSGTSYIWKVAVFTAIDSNKCDWVHVCAGIQRSPNSGVDILGILTFPEAENDDIGRVLERVFKCLKSIHPVFHNE